MARTTGKVAVWPGADILVVAVRRQPLTRSERCDVAVDGDAANLRGNELFCRRSLKNDWLFGQSAIANRVAAVIPGGRNGNVGSSARGFSDGARLRDGPGNGSLSGFRAPVLRAGDALCRG
jgi:hypothetical protein